MRDGRRPLELTHAVEAIDVALRRGAATLAALIGRADAALCTAKHDVRNCIRVSADAVVA